MESFNTLEKVKESFSNVTKIEKLENFYILSDIF